MKTCGAKTRDGDPCKNAQMANGRCRMHGGKIPQGIALPQTTTGRYSRHLPTRMLSTYEQSKSDPDLLALRDDVALVDSRLAELLKRVDSGESGATWRAVRQTFTEFKRANRAKDADAAREALDTLESLIVRGMADELAWADVRQTLEQRRKLVESERKRLVDMQQMVSAEQAMVLVAALTDSVRTHVNDPTALAAIADDLARLTHRQAA